MTFNVFERSLHITIVVAWNIDLKCQLLHYYYSQTYTTLCYRKLYIKAWSVA